MSNSYSLKLHGYKNEEAVLTPPFAPFKGIEMHISSSSSFSYMPSIFLGFLR